jgi:hypothetical protein
MRSSFTLKLVAMALAIFFVPSAFSQEQQPAQGQASPDSAAPATSGQTPGPADQPKATSNSPQAPPSQPSVPTTKSGVNPNSATRKPAARRKAKKPAATQSKKSGTQHSGTVSVSEGHQGKVVVRNGGAKDDTIHLAPGGSQEQEMHNRENTTQLLATTDENLKKVSGRHLNSSEQDTFDQIQSFVRQAKVAGDAGDLERAHMLAFKAHLLSDDLAKH